jgi:hypothetical protein
VSRSGAATRGVASPAAITAAPMPAAISVRRPGRGTVHAAVRLARLGSRSGRGRRGGRASSRLAVAAVRRRGSGGGGRSARVVAPEGAFLEVARLRCRAATAAVLSSSRSESRVNGSASSSSLSPSSMSNGFRLGDLDRGRGASSRLAGAASCDRRRSISAVARSIARPAARSSADSPCSFSRCPQSRSCASCWASIGRQYARNLCIARRNWVNRASQWRHTRAISQSRRGAWDVAGLRPRLCNKP